MTFHKKKALDSKVKAVNAEGERIIPLENFYEVLGNILEPDEIITEIMIPTTTSDTRQKFLKFRLRKAIDFAISSVATKITQESEVIEDVRIVLGGIAPMPYRAKSAEKILRGKKITKSLVDTAAKEALKEAKPLKMNAYKVPITEALVRRAIGDFL